MEKEMTVKEARKIINSTSHLKRLLFFTSVWIISIYICLFVIANPISITCAVIVTCLAVLISLIGNIFNITHSVKAGLNLGIVEEKSKRKLSMERLDAFLLTYENRATHTVWWYTILLILLECGLFISANLEWVALIIIISIVIQEIARFRVYQAIVEHKDKWAAAAYVLELQKIFGGQK